MKVLALFLILSLFLSLPFFTMKNVYASATLALNTTTKEVSYTLVQDSNGDPVILRGIDIYKTCDDTSGAWWFPPYDTWSLTNVNNFFNWVASNSWNFVRFQMNLDSIANNNDYRTKFLQVLSSAQTRGVYCLLCPAGLDEGYFCYTSGYPNWVVQPYTPYLDADNPIHTTAQYNSAMASMAQFISSYNNALIELWNEPTFGDWSAYDEDRWDNWVINVPITLTAIRATDFEGIIVVPMGVGFCPTWNDPTQEPYRRDTTCKGIIGHPEWFDQTYGSVMADYHAYYAQLRPYNFPYDKSSLETLWLSSNNVTGNMGGMITEAMDDYDIPMLLGETGLETADTDANKYIALRSALEICNENGINWNVHCGHYWDGWAICDNAQPPNLNDCGQVVKEMAEEPYVPPPTLPFFISGWENSNASDLTDITDDGIWTGGGAVTKIVVEDPVHSGDYALNISCPAGDYSSVSYELGNTTDILYFAGWYRFSFLPDGEWEIMNFHGISASGSNFNYSTVVFIGNNDLDETYWGIMNTENAGEPDLYNEASPTEPAINTWYFVILLRDVTNDNVSLWVYDTSYNLLTTATGSPSPCTVGGGTITAGITWSNDAVNVILDDFQLSVNFIAEVQGYLYIYSSPVSGGVMVNGSYWGYTPQVRNVTVGTYVVSFSPKLHYYTPENQIVSVDMSETVIVTGTYTAITIPPVSAITSLFNSLYIPIILIAVVGFGAILIVGRRD